MLLRHKNRYVNHGHAAMSPIDHQSFSIAQTEHGQQILKSTNLPLPGGSSWYCKLFILMIFKDPLHLQQINSSGKKFTRQIPR
ncbi:unnamed protein product [Ranitomeya imitator]|uniref:Uncharacterized protein n=1 Tax=Ranitomeya imitator TaxID=111125 RepID=A0ABN9MLZ9_9NEOB|nr:unnamed protein product [Ranitomeya imitator]